MTRRLLDTRLRSEFDRALRLRDDGDLTQAIQILRRLADEAPDQPSILGTLAGLQYQAGDYEHAAQTGRAVVRLAPRSGLASVTLFHSLNNIGRTDEALGEMSRFRSIAHYAEYDRLLAEIYDDASKRLEGAPLDPHLLKMYDVLRAEISSRPIKH